MATIHAMTAQLRRAGNIQRFFSGDLLGYLRETDVEMIAWIPCLAAATVAWIFSAEDTRTRA